MERLLEYVRYREAGERIAESFEARQRRFTRGAASDERARLADSEEEVTYRATLFDLLSALGAALERSSEASADYRHEIARESVHVDHQKAWLLSRLAEGGRARFRDLMDARSKPFIIATFLAVLELLQRQRVALRLGIEPEDFALEWMPPAEHSEDTPPLAA